jgi:glycosyltransferase involved in cell wall biosynthesis
MRYSIVIPTLNEEEIIEQTVKSYKKEFPYSEIIVVDGGSKDKTVEQARKAGANVYQEKTRNAAEALLIGFYEAKGEWIIMTDADGTYSAKDAKYLAGLAKGFDYDLIIGKRTSGRYLNHQIASGLIGLFTRLLFGVRTDDIASGLRVIKRSSLPFFTWNCVVNEGLWLEMIIRAKHLTYDYYPISYRPRTTGVSKIQGKGLTICWRYLKVIWKYLKLGRH